MSENQPDAHEGQSEDYEEESESQEELDRVPNIDNGEPLVDFLEVCPQWFLRRCIHFLISARSPRATERGTMLCEAASAVPAGLRLQVVEGYRPLVSQRAMNRHMFEQFRRDNPDWSDTQVQERADRFSAPPDAISRRRTSRRRSDLEIIDENGARLDLSSPYEILDSRQAAPNAPGLSQTARRDRAMLRRVLEPDWLDQLCRRVVALELR
jgi:D-alanyl-D-alanine dipeptidase